MSAYISHSLQDRAAFSAVSLALQGQGIKCWNPREMGTGSSLRSELYRAMQDCDICVFIATKNSLESRWCAAELGAFWGMGKRVAVFIAETGVTEESLPPQLRGDLWTNDIVEIIKVSKLEIDNRKRVDDERSRRFLSRRVSELAVADLLELILWSKSNRDIVSLDEVMTQLRNSMPSKMGRYTETEAAGAEAAASKYLSVLIGIPLDVAVASGKKSWQYCPIELETDTGKWCGFAREASRATVAEGYSYCLFMHLEAGVCDAAVLVESAWEHDTDGVRLGQMIAKCGKLDIGRPLVLR